MKNKIFLLILFLSIPVVSLASSKPQKPAVFVASPGSVTLEWSSINYDQCAGIKIYRSTSNYISVPATGQELVNLSCTATTYHDTAVTNGTLYYYSLFVYDTTNQYSDPATVSFVAQDPPSTPPASPTPPVVPPPSPSPVVSPPTSNPPAPNPSPSSGGGGGGGSSSGSSGSVGTNISPSVSSIPSAKITTNLSRGSQNSQVVILQRFLIHQGLLAAGNDSGYFGLLTEAAVKAFQRKYKIVSSGTPSSTGYGNVGPKTYGLINTLNVGSTASTQTNTSNQAQIQALLAQILILQAQLDKLNEH